MEQLYSPKHMNVITEKLPQVINKSNSATLERFSSGPLIKMGESRNSNYQPRSASADKVPPCVKSVSNQNCLVM